ncbi:MAG: cobamide remodeling phosphodiesterase CbiR [Candidatus Omnitrophota bacterium]|jgi:sugar phosphate isomerase/epimerase
MWCKKLPFRIGATSCIYPDDILPNVRKLKGKLDDIELVLFQSDNAGNIPTRKDLQELKLISNKWNLTYTVHLPLDIDLGSAISGKREDSIKKTVALIERLSVLGPYAYILHLNLSGKPERNIRFWQNRLSESLKKIAKFQPALAQNIAIENLSYPFSYIDTVILENGFSICVDIGHLIIMGVDPLKHLKRYFSATRVIHLHGVNRSKDHTSLKYLDAVLINHIIRFLKNSDYSGVLTLEVFSQADLKESMDVLREEVIKNK